MLSRDVNRLLKEGDKGVNELYKQHIKYFNLIDEWAERLTNGDLLDEYELSQCMERLTGCLMKLGSTAGALESLKEEMEHNAEVREYGKLEKIKAQDVSIVKATARREVGKIRKYATDFRNYFYSAQSSVTTAQSRLKRLTVTKSAKKVDYTGEIPKEQRKEYSEEEIKRQKELRGNNNEW